MNYFAKGALCVSVSAFAIAANAAYAQDGDDRIIVTATKREQAIQDVPFSINAQT